MLARPCPVLAPPPPISRIAGKQRVKSVLGSGAPAVDNARNGNESRARPICPSESVQACHEPAERRIRPAVRGTRTGALARAGAVQLAAFRHGLSAPVPHGVAA